MKQRINSIFSARTYPKNVNLVLLILRLVVGILMLTHGIGKLETLLGSGPIQFYDPLGVGVTASITLAVFAEVFCSILLIIGLGTRLAAIPLLFTMMVAIFVIHIDDGIVKQELPLLYAVIYIAIASIGSGNYSIDYLVLRNKRN